MWYMVSSIEYMVYGVFYRTEYVVYGIHKKHTLRQKL